MSMITLALGAQRAVDEVPFSDDYVLRVWNLPEGLRDNHVSSITCDGDGYLWFTNFSGLFRFDGVRMLHIDPGQAPGLPTVLLGPALSASDGSLWAVTEGGGVARINDWNTDIIIPKRQPVFNSALASLAEAKDGSIWAGATELARAVRMHQNAVSFFGVAEGMPEGKDTRIAIAADGTAWAATTEGCAIFDGTRFNGIDPEAGGARRPVLAPSREGGMWTSRGGKLIKYDRAGNRQEVLGPTWFQNVSQINTLLEDKAGILWIGTLDSGLFIYDTERRFHRIRTSFTDIYCLTEDNEGNIWCGTWGGGLNRFSPRRFFLRQIQPGAPGEVIRSICKDSEDRLWTVGRYGRLARSEPGAQTFLPVTLPGQDQHSITVCAAAERGVWLGTTRGLVRWLDGVAKPIPMEETILSLFAEGNESVWAGTEAGPLMRYSAEKIERFDEIQFARAMAVDGEGRLWVGTEQGELFMRQDGRFTRLAVPETWPKRSVRFIVPEGEGTLWIGTFLGGLYRYKNGRLQNVPESSRRPLDEIRSLMIERVRTAPSGNARLDSPDDIFWIGTASGLLRTSRAAIDAALSDESRALEPLVIAANEGVPHADFAYGFQNGVIHLSDGRILFGTALGLIEIPPGAAQKHRPSGRVFIEEAASGNLAYTFASKGHWVFPPDPDQIRVRYSMPELSSPEQVRFRYRVNNQAKVGRWADMGRQREITFARPAPGTFRVEVAAAVGDGPWTEPATAEISVRAAWWETPLFRWTIVTLCIALIGAAARAIEMQRTRLRIRRLEQERVVERERSRIARDMHDDVGANLTHITTTVRLAAMDSPAAAGAYLREIETAARHTVESLDEIVWAVNPRNDTIAKAVEYLCKFAATFLSKAEIHTEVSAPAVLPDRHISAEARHHLFLAVKEAVNNIVKHSAAKNVEVQVQMISGRLQITIRDDGHGFDAGADSSFSNGLINLRERMTAIGGTCAVESRPAITGCRVTFEVPLDAPA